MTILRLDGAHCTLLLQQRQPTDMPEIVHFGARLPGGLTGTDVALLRDRAIPPNALDDDVPQATLFPTLGTGQFVSPALAAHRGGTDWTGEFAVATIHTEASAIGVRAYDEVARLGLEIRLELLPGQDVLTMCATLSNRGDLVLDVANLAAGVFLLPPRADVLLGYGARWGHEFAEQRLSLPAFQITMENRRGRTSHDRFPLLIAGTAGLDEDRGEAWGVHLGASGNHRTTAERLPDGSLLVQAGELLHPGEVRLAPGDSIETPCAYAAWSDQGLAGLSRAFHAGVRTLLRWSGGTMTPRPVTLNTWEATYFDHDERRLMQQAEAAARLGIERFVLDDGWMRGRRDDRAGLGNWMPDPVKYPQGLAPLAQHVVSLGMQFGLWVEPEMATPDSDFLRANPEAVLHVSGRALRTARHQLVLDLTRPVAFAAVLGAMRSLLAELPIAYLKWDMNRALVAAGDAQGRPAFRAQVLALYDMLDRLRAEHPSLEIESCASGGARADLGMLVRTHRVWASDCTDPLDRLSIQRGASRLLPPEVLGAHVSASPNHQTGRRHTLAFRAAVALPFHFGIELDALALDHEERAELATWIALHKRLRPLLHGGRHVALPMQDGASLRGVVAADGRHAVYLIAQEATPLHAIPAPWRLPGLGADTRYRLTAPPPQVEPARVSATHRALFAQGASLSGGLLTQTGIVLPALDPASALVLEALAEGV